jgi:hypothetical protein
VGDLLDLLKPEFPLPPSAHAGVEAAERALAEDAWWRSCAEVGLRYLASTGDEFDAGHLAELGLPEPRHPNMLGALFRCAARDGLIEPVGVRPSVTASRRGGLVRVWRGVAA